MMCEFQNSWKHLRWPVCSPSGGMLADDLSLYILFPVTQSPSHNHLLAHPHFKKVSIFDLDFLFSLYFGLAYKHFACKYRFLMTTF